MDLEAAYFISQIVATVALVGSLIFVGLQVREAKRQTAIATEQTALSNKIAQAQFSASVSANFHAAMRMLIENPEVAAAFRKVMFEEGTLEPVEKTQILTYFNAMIAALHESLAALEVGLVSDDFMIGMETNMRWYLTAPAFRKEWQRIVSIKMYDERFVVHVNERCLPVAAEAAE